MPQQLASLTLHDARRIVAAGEARAAEIGQPMNIAVVDAGGDLVLLVRMDGAWRGSVDIAINKAFTARAFDITTAELADMAKPGGPFFGIHASNDGKVVILPGGAPVLVDGVIAGAVGVSGGTGEQDTSVCEAAAAAV